MSDEFFDKMESDDFDPASVPVETGQVDLKVKREAKKKHHRRPKSDKASTRGYSLYDDEVMYLKSLKRRLEDMEIDVSLSFVLRAVIARTRELGDLPSEELERIALELLGRDLRTQAGKANRENQQ